MLKYFIQVVQNALPGAIPVSLLYAVLYGMGGEMRKRVMVWGGIAGTGAALILSVLRTFTRLVNREYVNIVVLSLAIPAGILCIVLLLDWRKKEALERKLLGWTGAILTALLLFYTLPTIFLYTREFVAPGESVFSTEFLFKLTGYFAGLFLVILCSLALFHAGKNLPPRLVGILLSLNLTVNMVSQVSVIVQVLLARRIIRAPRWLFRIIVQIINNNAVFLYILMGISVFLPVFLFIRSLRITESWRNPAERRKLVAMKRRLRRWSFVSVLGYLAAILTLTAVKAYSEKEAALSPAEPMDIQGNEIIIPVEKIGDWHLHRYNYTASENIEMRFIVIRKNEAAYGVGLDACDICGPTGYYERRDGVVCRLCDVVMNISTIGFKGGCNPVPLAYTMRGGNMIIQTADLEAERGRFK
ncbi:MAG: Fe-S-containing protein [Treponema sp.]|jgi:uncharacterized membrane protein|nr:Fe-S-containing protein [Treponema sp.]